MPDMQTRGDPTSDRPALERPALIDVSRDVPAATGVTRRLVSLTGEHRQGLAAQAIAAGRLTVWSERRGSSHVVTVQGELDLATAAAVEHELYSVEATDARMITLDLSGLDFMDLTGLHLVTAAHARSRAAGSRLRLTRGPGQVQRVFEVTATADRLPFAA